MSPDKFERIEDTTRIVAGDEIELEFVDDPPWLQLDIFKADAAEFAIELFEALQSRALDIGQEGGELILLPLSIESFEREDEDGDTVIGALVHARVQDVRPKAQQVQEASFATGARIVIALGFAFLAVFAIHPLFVEARRLVRGFTEEEKPGQGKPAVPPVPLSVVAVLALGVIGFALWLYSSRKVRAL